MTTINVKDFTYKAIVNQIKHQEATYPDAQTTVIHLYESELSDKARLPLHEMQDRLTNTNPGVTNDLTITSGKSAPIVCKVGSVWWRHWSDHFALTVTKDI